MAQHTVTIAQNIYDVAIQLYGSIEGIYDLMISNQWLSMDTELKSGDILEYHDYFVINKTIVNSLSGNNIVVANGQRTVTEKLTYSNPILILVLPANEEKVQLNLVGTGLLKVDWGDDEAIDAYELSDTTSHCAHSYSDKYQGNRTIRIYGNFTITSWDMSNLRGDLYWLQADGGGNKWTNQPSN